MCFWRLPGIGQRMLRAWPEYLVHWIVLSPFTLPDPMYHPGWSGAEPVHFRLTPPPSGHPETVPAPAPGVTQPR